MALQAWVHLVAHQEVLWAWGHLGGLCREEGLACKAEGHNICKEVLCLEARACRAVLVCKEGHQTCKEGQEA